MSFSHYVVLAVRPSFFFFLLIRMQSCNISRSVKDGANWHSRVYGSSFLLRLIVSFLFYTPFYETKRKKVRVRGANGSYHQPVIPCAEFFFFFFPVPETPTEVR